MCVQSMASFSPSPSLLSSSQPLSQSSPVTHDVPSSSSSRKDRILKIAQALFDERKRAGAIAVLSPTPADLIEEALACVASRNSAAVCGCLIDVGCGDGRWVNSFVQSYLGHGIGLDIEESRLTLAVEGARNMLSSSQRERVDYILGSYSLCSFSTASIVVVYLSRYGNDVVKAKLLAECQVNTIIIAVGVSTFILQTLYSK
jgi:SAM-dependent methyltransferase